MLKTKITELLKIDHPIMQGGMQHLGTIELASAVSNAGGLGTINATAYPTLEEFRSAIRSLKSLTKNPFCVNVSMLPNASPGELTAEYFKVIVEEDVPVVETAGRNPVEYVPMLKSADIKLIHKVPAVKFAKKAEEIGADIVTIVGFECAGHPGMEDVTTMILANKVAKTVKIPIFVGGGIADGAGLVAALALGGEGVVMGTRFVATEECTIHSKFKECLVNSCENDTMLVQRSIKNMVRAMKNNTAFKVAEMEKRGTTLQELLPIISGKVGRRCQAEGDLEGSIFAIGQTIGLINEIKPVKKVIEDMINEAETILARFNSITK
ncbi:nitronate monooxygenase family protein [Sporomusa sp. KB1]|jgi:nitronate monooxygenase|uniref:NAD(P)H-dependent flavin oxidoreductase n=1 Tax=Sporomusa sp. KB1 TaxID=943346 RepID=UPI0011A86456|nr:nitronate monooxygenase [Sporomusa sp. KB1]TWH46749.1 nitronate monooxygenase [Sporomusa sp. KB1]